MANRKTAEELEAETQELIEVAEALPDEDESEEDNQDNKEEESETDENDEDVVVEDEVEAETEETPEPEQVDPEAELKKKLSASARENQKILAKNRLMNQAVDEAKDIPEPTDEEMELEYSEWDLMDVVSKRLAKEAVVSKRFRERISQAREQSSKIEKWGEEVDKYVDNPQTFLDNPLLEGKQEEFKLFAIEESNNSVPFKILVNAFLFEQSTKKQPAKKGKMFETGSGGPNDNPRPKGDKISIAESELLRKTNYSKYKEMLNAGKIDYSDL